MTKYYGFEDIGDTWAMPARGRHAGSTLHSDTRAVGRHRKAVKLAKAKAKAQAKAAKARGKK